MKGGAVEWGKGGMEKIVTSELKYKKNQKNIWGG